MGGMLLFISERTLEAGKRVSLRFALPFCNYSDSVFGLVFFISLPPPGAVKAIGIGCG